MPPQSTDSATNSDFSGRRIRSRRTADFRGFELAGEPGFEPGPTESESAVLPLNYSPEPGADNGKPVRSVAIIRPAPPVQGTAKPICLDCSVTARRTRMCGDRILRKQIKSTTKIRPSRSGDWYLRSIPAWHRRGLTPGTEILDARVGNGDSEKRSPSPPGTGARKKRNRREPAQQRLRNAGLPHRSSVCSPRLLP